MAQLTQLNLKAKPRDVLGADEHTRTSSKHKTALLIGSLIVAFLSGVFLLETSGCSKTSKPAVTSSANQNPSNQSSSTQAAVVPTLSSPTAVPVTSQPPATKKRAKRRPSTVTYRDPVYGVSFQYPRKYTLKTGDKAKLDLAGLGPVPTNFVQPGGVTLATVELPRDSYRDTDFASAFFNVSVNPNLTSEQCAQFAAPVREENESIPASKVKVGGIEFAEVEDAMEQADAKYYHVFQNAACYEFALGLGTGGDGTEDGTAPVDPEEVFRKLEKILSTVKIKTKTEVVPEVATGVPSRPAEGDNR